MKSSKNITPAIILVAVATEAVATAPVAIKPLNKQNQIELKALILEIGGETAEADIKAIDDQKLSVAKTRQQLINLASSFLPEEQEFEAPVVDKKAEAKAAKLAANVATVLKAEFVEAEGIYSKGDLNFTTEQLSTLTVKQLEKAMTPKAPAAVKEDFKGYTPEEIEAQQAMVGHIVNFIPSARFSDDIKKEKDGTVLGIVKSAKVESRSGRCYVEIYIKGADKTAWTRETSKGFRLGEKATDADLIDAKIIKAPKVETPKETETAPLEVVK